MYLVGRILIGFLVMHIDENKSDWFQTIAGSIVQVDDDKIVNYLTHLFYQLVKQNVELSYLLITKRFESLGRKNFLESFWHELVNQNHELFHEQLTKWFNAENRNIHSAILKLTSLSEIHEHDFALSEKVLTTINSSEKLYVAMKIAGYMYSKEHLQSLIISLVRSVKEDEANLLAELYDIFYSYVIYNYRSTLDMISEEAKKENTPSHIANFYDQLEKAYEIYFQNFSLIKSHSELSHDSPLSQHLQYYKQQQLSVGLKESQKHSFMDSMKKVQLHSNNWASRNSSENQHHIRTLEKFGISVEFPAGEIYNPILQESKRRLYQRIKKHEINID
ncbi:MAG TPA: hypothetical protein VNQ80_06705 [Parapedobacter sp.]|uniref:hypothetical protein n=1 Tax=Parapedobacter sp. TaxID=1958893 RepID=UPI002C71162C|nr:hypothetical protein [Parapedobacter sp.]HWK57006.1 hypothetical protein [Parapedobacter sp.]